MRFKLPAALVGVLAPLLLWGVGVSVPHSFDNGTVADADAVNANFEALRSQLDHFSFDGGNIGAGVASPDQGLHVGPALRLEPQASAPANSAAGDLYAGTDGKLYFHDGGGFAEVGASGGGGGGAGGPLPSGVLPSDVLHHFDFDNNTTDDGTRGGGTFTQGALAFVPGASGQAVTGFSTSNYIGLSRLVYSSYTGTGLTLAGWVKGTGRKATAGHHRSAYNLFGDNNNSWWVGAGISSARASIIANPTRHFSQTDIADDNWHHVAWTLEYNGGRWSVTTFVDGQAETTGGLDSGGNSAFAIEVIGATYFATSQYFGYAFDEVYVFGKTLTPAQVAELAGTTGNTNSTNLPAGVLATDVLNHVPFDNGVDDEGVQGGGTFGAGTLSSVPGALGQAASGFSTSNYLGTTRVHWSSHTGTGLTLAIWVKGTGTDASPGHHRVAYNAFGDNDNSWWVGSGISSGVAAIRANPTHILGTTPVSDDQWHHIAWALDYNGNWDVDIYVDGELDASGTLDTSGSPHYAIDVIGATYLATSQSFGYQYDDAWIIKKTLTQTQIQELAGIAP